MTKHLPISIVYVLDQTIGRVIPSLLPWRATPPRLPRDASPEIVQLAIAIAQANKFVRDVQLEDQNRRTAGKRRTKRQRQLVKARGSIHQIMGEALRQCERLALNVESNLGRTA